MEEEGEDEDDEDEVEKSPAGVLGGELGGGRAGWRTGCVVDSGVVEAEVLCSCSGRWRRSRASAHACNAATSGLWFGVS